MPTYTLRDIKTKKTWDVTCTWDELQSLIESSPNVEKVLSAPLIVSGVGNLHSKVPDGFKDKLNQIKKGSSKDDTIKT